MNTVTERQIQTLAANINAQLAKTGMTQRELAEKTGVDFTNISRYCTGSRVPKAFLLLKMAEVFGCTMEELMQGISEAELEEDPEQPAGGGSPEQKDAVES